MVIYLFAIRIVDRLYNILGILYFMSPHSNFLKRIPARRRPQLRSFNDGNKLLIFHVFRKHFLQVISHYTKILFKDNAVRINLYRKLSFDQFIGKTLPINSNLRQFALYNYLIYTGRVKYKNILFELVS